MIIYLATHYTHEDPAVMEQRYHDINRLAARIMVYGHTVFSPVSHSHAISKHMPDGAAVDHDLWMRQDLPLLAMCDEMWIWPKSAMATSRGVWREAKEAWDLDIPVRWLGCEGGACLCLAGGGNERRG